MSANPSPPLDATTLRAALVKVRAHTSHRPDADRELLAGLLHSIERITDAALADAAAPRPVETACTCEPGMRERGEGCPACLARSSAVLQPSPPAEARVKVAGMLVEQGDRLPAEMHARCLAVVEGLARPVHDPRSDGYQAALRDVLTALRAIAPSERG